MPVARLMKYHDSHGMANQVPCHDKGWWRAAQVILSLPCLSFKQQIVGQRHETDYHCEWKACIFRRKLTYMTSLERKSRSAKNTSRWMENSTKTCHPLLPDDFCVILFGDLKQIPDPWETRTLWPYNSKVRHVYRHLQIPQIPLTRW